MAVAEISITLQLSVIVSNERTSYPTVWSNNSNKQVAYDKVNFPTGTEIKTRTPNVSSSSQIIQHNSENEGTGLVIYLTSATSVQVLKYNQNI
ncbi:hypothetical protein BLOT_005231 [Blomia tropicalis]|nr:hypothetical protein BLOT_005231 [Blomia tropicalis]